MAGTSRAVCEWRRACMRQLWNKATVATLADVLGLHRVGSVQRVRRDCGLPTRPRIGEPVYDTPTGRPYGRRAVQFACDAILRGEPLPEHLDMVSEPKSKDFRAVWTHGQYMDIVERVGHEPLYTIACDYGVDRKTLIHQLRRGGDLWRAYERSAVKLMDEIRLYRGLRVSDTQVGDWCREGVLRCYKEGMPDGMGWAWIVDESDWNWMLDNYEWHMRVPKHPGLDYDELAAAWITRHDQLVRESRSEVDADWLDQEKQLMHRRRGAALTANVNARYKAREQERAA